MALSSDLISQFVKATKDGTKRKQESTVYGTIVEHEGKKYAKLDGSSLLTPVVTTAAVKVGERVTVLIKNHTATVTGNISSPSASSGDVSDLSESVSGIKASVGELGNNKILWSGGHYMSNSQTATLSAAISDQTNGVVLLWSYYVDEAVDDSNFCSFFIPKQFVSSHNGKGIGMFMTNDTMSIAASKYVYVSDTSIKGHSNNSSEAATKTCGITSTPKKFVLRYVVGV